MDETNNKVMSSMNDKDLAVANPSNKSKSKNFVCDDTLNTFTVIIMILIALLLQKKVIVTYIIFFIQIKSTNKN